MKILHEDYQIYYAKQCLICNGNATILDGNIRRECVCQKKARRKFRFEQIDIYPPDLKYKDWSDFTGIITKQDKIIGHLTTQSVLNARNKAFSYCYKAPFSLDILKNRGQYLKVHHHLDDGQNIIIAGDEQTGKTLLAAIICKEVANASVLVNRDLDYRWIKFYDIINAARWNLDYNTGQSKQIDHPFLDRLSELDFLFIDAMDLQRGGHNSPADHISMDSLFGARILNYRPTIVICSKRVTSLLSTGPGQEQLAAAYGFQFMSLLKNSNNLLIELVKDVTTTS